QGYNRYAYAANNPATLTDPSGHMAQVMATATIGAAGLAVTAEASGSVPLLTAMLANPLMAVFVLVVIIAVVLIVAHEQGWCADHGVTTCVAEWQAGGTAVFDAGRSWAHVFRGGGTTTVERPQAVPRPVTPPSRPRYPPRPVRPEPANNPSPETEPRPQPCSRWCPVPIDSGDEDNETRSCFEAVGKEFLIDPIKTHIQRRHGPQATRDGTNGVFEATFFADIENRIYDVLYAPTEVYRPGSGQADCLFEGTFPNQIGRDPSNQRTRTMGVLIDLNGYIRSAYPCYDSPGGCNARTYQ
ncbi:MAG: hypothetical protein QOJ59_2791, partial [Thermomicrobiales bacterium]|nr:hypothetical protein [Thermomicrobiales bacterium]